MCPKSANSEGDGDMAISFGMKSPLPNIISPKYKARAYIWDSVCAVKIMNEHGQRIYRSAVFTFVLL